MNGKRPEASLDSEVEHLMLDWEQYEVNMLHETLRRLYASSSLPSLGPVWGDAFNIRPHRPEPQPSCFGFEEA